MFMLEREAKISDLSTYLKKLKPRVKRKKEIIKIRVEINGIERRKPYRETKQNKTTTVKPEAISLKRLIGWITSSQT